MASAPEWWVPLPAKWPRKPAVSQLRAEFGAVGPLAFAVLLAECCDQFYGTSKATRVPGRVKLGWVELGYLAACESVAARTVVQRMADLEQIVIDDLSDASFTARFVDWEKWQDAGPPKDPEATERKQRQRAREKRDAVTCHATGTENREQALHG